MAKIILSTLILTLCTPTFAASFDCAKAASVTEKLICGDERLSKLDEQLASSYSQILKASSDKDTFKKTQFEWLKQQRACKDAVCLTQVYKDRITHLANIPIISVQPLPDDKSLVTISDSPSASTKTVAKKPITFQLVDGFERPICQQYIQMLKTTNYTEFPACERKVLPQFPQFKAIEWTEITDKQEMTRVIEERFQINSKMDSLQAIPPSLSIGERSDLLDYIRKDELKMYSYKIDINGDGVIDVVYRIDMKDAGSKKYNQCEAQSIFYVNDLKVTLNTITEKTKNYYRGFSFSDSSNELFLFNDIVYSSDWAGKFISAGSNLDIYEVGNNKLCGILVK
jgi:uncharacterized protein